MVPWSIFSKSLLVYRHCFNTRQPKPRCVSNILLTCCSEELGEYLEKSSLSHEPLPWGVVVANDLPVVTGLWLVTEGFYWALHRVTMDRLFPDNYIMTVAINNTKLCHTLSPQPARTTSRTKAHSIMFRWIWGPIPLQPTAGDLAGIQVG